MTETGGTCPSCVILNAAAADATAEPEQSATLTVRQAAVTVRLAPSPENGRTNPRRIAVNTTLGSRDRCCNAGRPLDHFVSGASATALPVTD